MSKRPHEIKAAIERTMKVLERQPAVGRVTKQATARIESGLTCEVQEGGWRYTLDMPAAVGGADQGPTGVGFTRMGLGGCLSIGYAMWLAREGVPHESIEVTVEGDVDQSGVLGVDPGQSPSHDELRVVVRVQSDAPPAEIDRVLALADRFSPMLHLITNPIPVRRELELTAPAAPKAVAR